MDVFNQELMADPVFGGVAALHIAWLIYEGVGTDYEPRQYNEEEQRWAYFVLRKPFRYKS